MDVKSLFGVEGKTVLVTGGGRGIGAHIAEGFVRNGATVYIVSRSKAACEAKAAELTNMGPGKCIALSADLSNVAACEEVAKKLQDSGVTKLHVLVNNSGVSWGEPVEKHSEKGWDKVMDLNVKAIFFLTKSLLPLLKAAGTFEDPARVINVGSIFGIGIQLFPTIAYDVSKAAVHHLTRKLAGELSDRKITVNAIAPGFVPSKMSSQLSVYQPKDMMAKTIPLGRPGTPADMAGAAIYLSSRAGAWVTGSVLTVDGGFLVNPKHMATQFAAQLTSKL